MYKISIVHKITLILFFISGMSFTSLFAEELPVIHKASLHSPMRVSSHFLCPDCTVSLSKSLLTLPEEKIMAITIDDGPDPRDREFSEVLKKHDALATFFYIGEHIPAYPDVAKEMQAEGHEVATHGNRHNYFLSLSSDQQERNIHKGRDVLAKLGIQSVWFRPPYGAFNANTVKIAKDLGQKTVLWSIDSRDWAKRNTSAIAQTVISQFHPGAVILIHSHQQASLEALPLILTAGQQQGYRFVTLSSWEKVLLTASCRVNQNLCPTVVASAAPLHSTSSQPVVADVAPIEPPPESKSDEETPVSENNSEMIVLQIEN
ncbi:MAG: polysaccharide deacetylase family protein [Magnetococcales bacterium]|nr:polysaccharide deacetylase family protein [Magnetococcales bacterium]